MLRGGFIETSGHVFNFTGGSVNAGRGGAWLLDPVDLTIDATLAGTIATALNGGSNVTQLTSATGTGGNGDITVASGISWSTNATLTLSAYRNIAVNANITSTGGGGVVLGADNAGTGTGTVTFGGGQISTAGTVSIFYNPTGSNSTVNATKYTAPTQTNFSGNVTGGATLKTNMLVNNVYDLQNMNNNKAGTYALGRDIDAGITSTWNSGAGFQPIGGGNSLHRKPGRPGPHDLRPLHQSAVRPKRRADRLSRRRRHGKQRWRHRCDHHRMGDGRRDRRHKLRDGQQCLFERIGHRHQCRRRRSRRLQLSDPVEWLFEQHRERTALRWRRRRAEQYALPVLLAGSISQVYATGAVTGTGGSPSADRRAGRLQRQLHHAILLG